MQGALLPSRVYQEIDCANRNFLWGSTPEKRKIHLVNWNTVTLPIDQGGLSIHVARPRILALLAKLDWKLSTSENLPWAKVLRAKYISSRITCSPWLSKGACSRTYRLPSPLLILV